MAESSTGRVIAGPDVVCSVPPISLATTAASVVLPRPGGPEKSTWSKGSLREDAASMSTRRFSFTRLWPQ